MEPEGPWKRLAAAPLGATAGFSRYTRFLPPDGGERHSGGILTTPSKLC